MQVRIAPGNTKPISEVNSSLNETQAMKAVDFEQEINLPPPDGPSTQPLKVNKPKRWRWVFLGVLLVFIGAGVGGWIGYNAAVKARLSEQKNNIALVTTTQFQLAMLDQAEGRLDTARKRLEYIVQLNPYFPVSLQNWLEVMMAQLCLRLRLPQ